MSLRNRNRKKNIVGPMRSGINSFSSAVKMHLYSQRSIFKKMHGTQIILMYVNKNVLVSFLLLISQHISFFPPFSFKVDLMSFLAANSHFKVTV